MPKCSKDEKSILGFSSPLRDCSVSVWVGMRRDLRLLYCGKEIAKQNNITKLMSNTELSLKCLFVKLFTDFIHQDYTSDKCQPLKWTLRSRW